QGVETTYASSAFVWFGLASRGDHAAAPNPLAGERRGGIKARQSFLDAATLWRAAAVVCAWGNVLDGPNLKASSLQRADRGFASRARALDENVNLAKSVLLSTLCSSLGGHLCSVRSGLARALEANLAGRGPRDYST